MKLSALRQDRKVIEGGEWVGDLPQMGALRLRVRGLSSTLYTTELAKLMRAVPRDQRDFNGNPKTDATFICVGKSMAKHILLEWDGLEDDDGKMIPYTKELAYKMLSDPEYRPFVEIVTTAAGRVDNGQNATTEDIEGNYAAPSTSTSSAEGANSTVS